MPRDRSVLARPLYMIHTSHTTQAKTSIHGPGFGPGSIQRVVAAEAESLTI
jgi:hypothetical protein